MEGHEQLWAVEKGRQGKYLNSPLVYFCCGFLRDDSPENAVMRAAFITGSSQVRIVPVSETPYER